MLYTWVDGNSFLSLYMTGYIEGHPKWFRSSGTLSGRKSGSWSRTEHVELQENCCRASLSCAWGVDAQALAGCNHKTNHTYKLASCDYRVQA